jgi:Lar family restriction alleviation protein
MIIEIEAGVELKACPFCGGDAVLRTENKPKFKYTDPDEPLLFWVKCTNARCAVSPQSKDKQDAAIETWNRRA